MATQSPTTPTTRQAIPTNVLAEVYTELWQRTFLASLHPGLVTLATTTGVPEEDTYLVRPIGDGIEILGPLAVADWRNGDYHERQIIAPKGFTWQRCAEAQAREFYPWGAWYVAESTPEGERYRHTGHGFTAALEAFNASADAPMFRAQPRAIGRVPCVVLYPDGRYEVAPDASALPIVLPLTLVDAGHLHEAVQDRLWPGGSL